MRGTSDDGSVACAASSIRTTANVMSCSRRSAAPAQVAATTCVRATTAFAAEVDRRRACSRALRAFASRQDLAVGSLIVGARASASSAAANRAAAWGEWALLLWVLYYDASVGVKACTTRCMYASFFK